MLYIDITRLYNNTRLGKIATGVDRVSLAYLRQYARQACALVRLTDQWLFFPFERSQFIFENLLLNQSFKIKFFEKKIYTLPKKGEANFVLNTSHSGLESPIYAKYMQQYGLEGIYFLHDNIPIDYPEYCRAGEFEKHFQRLKNLLDAKLVIANSQYTLDRFYVFCQKYHYKPPPTIWAHLGIEEISKKTLIKAPTYLDLLIEDKPYFVILGTIEARKNHLFLLNLWRELVKQLGDECPKLFIVGKRGWECEQVIDILDRSIELKQVIVELNYCQDHEVNYLLQHCQALLFPSFVEGFGLPFIQSIYHDIPVIANDIPIFRELNYGGAQLISTMDGKAWLQIIIDYLKSDLGNRMNQILAIEREHKELPTWRHHFTIVNPAIEKAMGRI